MGLSQIEAVGVGSGFACAVEASGEVWCWGDGTWGQLGNGETQSSVVPVAVSGISNAIDIAVGQYHACAVETNGDVKCWGRGAKGQLGDSTNNNRSEPVALYTSHLGSEDVTAVKVVAGNEHTCALLETGKVMCWGDNLNGQVGETCGESSYCAQPWLVPGAEHVVEIDAGVAHNCLIDEGAAVKCWGPNGHGQLGDGTYQLRRDAVMPVVGLPLGAEELGLAGYSSCVTSQGGVVDCWGNNTYGTLGNGQTGSASPVPLRSSLAVDASKLDMGVYHGCSLQAVGNLWCWGRNNAGQVGDGSVLDRSTPVAVTMP